MRQCGRSLIARFRQVCELLEFCEYISETEYVSKLQALLSTVVGAIGQVGSALLFARRRPILVNGVTSARLKGPVTRLNCGDQLSTEGNRHHVGDLRRDLCHKDESASSNDACLGAFNQAIDPATRPEIHTFPRKQPFLAPCGGPRLFLGAPSIILKNNLAKTDSVNA